MSQEEIAQAEPTWMASIGASELLSHHRQRLSTINPQPTRRIRSDRTVDALLPSSTLADARPIDIDLPMHRS